MTRHPASEYFSRPVHESIASRSAPSSSDDDKRSGWRSRRCELSDGGVPAEPVRVVIDANVFVSAAIWRGPSTRLIDAWMSGQASF